MNESTTDLEKDETIRKAHVRELLESSIKILANWELDEIRPVTNLWNVNKVDWEAIITATSEEMISLPKCQGRLLRKWIKPQKAFIKMTPFQVLLLNSNFKQRRRYCAIT